VSKPTSLADLIKSSVLCATFSKNGRFWPYREGHLKVAFSFDHALSAGEAYMDKSNDQDRGKGAAERDQKNEGGNSSMPGQLGHRDEDEELKNADSGLSG
jgi:hypothetical protein